VELKWEDCEGVVVADVVDRLVKIFITGPRSRCREFLAVIRQKFDEQHASLRGVTVFEKIPLKGQPTRMLDYRDLIKREARKEEIFYPENADSPVNVRELLDGVETSAVRESRKQALAEKEGGGTQIINNYNYDQITQHVFGGEIMKDESGKTVQNISGGTFNASAVVAKADVFNWQANIAAAHDSTLKLELEQLSRLVSELIQKASPEVAESAERNMQVFSEQALSKSPDKDYLTIAAKRLTTAAATVATVANPIIETVEKVIGLLS
jgi:hypothetical protein